MNNLTKLIEELRTRKLTMREVDDQTVWSQTERNQIRTELIDALVTDLELLFLDSPCDAEVYRTTDGATINVQSEEWGSFCFSLAPKMHDLEYDVYDESEQWLEKQELKKQKKLAKK